MPPVRTDVDAAGLPAELARTRDAARPILVGPELLTWLDQAKRTRLLKDWRRALQSRIPEDPDRNAPGFSAAPG
jgi:iron(III) transport system substrate-binding protein